MPEKSKQKHDNHLSANQPLRLWPGVIAAMLLLVAKLIVPVFMQDALPIVMFGGLFLAVAIVVWWLFFSRAPVVDRLAITGLLVVSLIVVRPFLHETIAKAGMGLLFPILAIPISSLALAISAVISSRFSLRVRRAVMIMAIFWAAGAWALVRTEGLDNSGNSDLAWRWTSTAEEQLLENIEEEVETPVDTPVELNGEAEWPGFRGPRRDSIIRDVRIETDWSATPPELLWRQPVGPGWSSFAVHGELCCTQEQRGEEEVVSCYNLLTGETVWIHSDKTRFWESNGGAGPRGTPTIYNGRVYSLGGTGMLNVLDLRDGRLLWSRNVQTDTGTKIPMWGFSGSPLVFNNMVIVSAAGSLIAYNLSTGESLWSKTTNDDCYSSPHLLLIDGIDQVLLQNQAGILSLSPTDGSLLWHHEWTGQPIVQPALTPDGDVLVSVDDRNGIRRLHVTHEISSWVVEERWTSDRIKPYFNDSVIHNGYVYGFDGPRLACMDLKDGARQWKGGRYGRGQFLLLADQDVLLVLSEKGELALVKAEPDEFVEIAKVAAIEGKTWNHPVLVNDILLVRNAEEMAAFRLVVNERSH